MQLRFSPSMRSITISSSSSSSNSNNNNNNNGFVDLMKIKVAARHISYLTLFHTILILAFLLPFVFILTAVVTLEGVNKCSSFGCLGRHFGPRILRRDDSGRLVKDFYKVLNEVKGMEVPDTLKLPDSFNQLISEMKHNQYDARTLAILLKAMMEKFERDIREAKFAELMNKHFAASSIPKGIHCLSLRLTDEYSSNAHARKQLPSPELLPLLSDNSYYHFVLSTDNILAASVVVTSIRQSSLKPEKIVFHVITDKKTYAGMHSWFALNPVTPAIIEIKGIHQFDWLTRENVPVLEVVENHNIIRNYYHGNHIAGANLSDTTPRKFASKLQSRSPKYISLLNHIRIYLPELFPNLDKVVFLDDDIVIQRDLSPLWEIDLDGKVNGAVETCKGEDEWVMSKHFKNYFNFSHPLIAKHLDPELCAWAYGMNIFDLRAWRDTDIRETYHYWLKENLKSNLTMWKLGTLPPALLAFKGHVHPDRPIMAHAWSWLPTPNLIRECLKLIPHRKFSFAKSWLLAAQFEIRQGNLDSARRILGNVIGQAPKDKIFKKYIEIELQFGNMDRCRKLYEKYLEWSTENCYAWRKYAELEISLDETECARSIFELAISQSALDMPEVLWKAYIDFEISEGEFQRTRELYERLLDRTKHVKVWISYAKFEASTVENESGTVDMSEDDLKLYCEEQKKQSIQRARGVFERAVSYLRTSSPELKEERAMVLEECLNMESNAGELGDVSLVQSKLPKKLKRKRPIVTEDGPVGFEEYIDYLFPEEAQTTNLDHGSCL